MRKDRLFYLDFIRAISAVLIVIFHFNTTMASREISVDFYFLQNYANGNSGYAGVSLFFVISGAALMYTYKDSFNFADFFKKRFLSLYPMFWIAYFFAFIFLFYVNGTIKHSVPNLNFLLTVIGMDGYLHYALPTYYILGEWFLGCIILLYLCFPILRILVIRFPKTLFISVFVLYILSVKFYNFEMHMDRNFFMRIPDLLIGMYFVQYIKKVKHYQFLIALVVSLIMLFIRIEIALMFKITIIGASLFLVFAYVASFIKSDKVIRPFSILSKYSYAIFLVHHVIFAQLMNKFKGMALTNVEVLCLFIISVLILAFLSMYLYKISGIVTRYCNKCLSSSK